MKNALYSLLAILALVSCSKEEEVVAPPAPNKYTLTITADTGGSVSSPGGTYNEGSKITVTATPDGMYLFKEWSDGSTQNPREITVTSNLTLKASFIKKTYPLAVTVEGEGTVAEEVIVQGSTTETEYNAGTTVRLTATPNEGWVFAGWSGDVESEELVIEVPIEKGTSVSALFKRDSFELNITIEGEGTVKEEVIVQPGQYDYGTTMRLTAISEDGWRFLKWEGDIDSNSNPIEIDIKLSNEIKAVFTEAPFLFKRVKGEGYITEEVISTTEDKTIIKLKAFSEDGWKFVRWQGDVIDYNEEIEIDLSGARAVTASFVQFNTNLKVYKSYFNIPYSQDVRTGFNVGGGKKYFNINNEEYLMLLTDAFDSYLLKKESGGWVLKDIAPSFVSGLSINNYRGMGKVIRTSENEFLVPSNGEANSDPSTWGSYIYKGRIENNQLSYEKITDFRTTYYGLAYGDLNNDDKGDIIVNSMMFLQKDNGVYEQYDFGNQPLGNSTSDNIVRSFREKYKNEVDIINTERYHQIEPFIGQRIADLYTGGRPEIIMSNIDVSDKVSEDEIVPRGDVLIYEFDQSTDKYELIYELPRRTVGEVETTEDIQVYDVNNDGINDILLSIVSGDSANEVNDNPPFEVWLGNIDKTFTKYYEFDRIPAGGSGYEVIDINLDGYLDIFLLPSGDSESWIKDWYLSCDSRERQGLPCREGLMLQNLIYLNDGTGKFNPIDKLLDIENTFVMWLKPVMENGTLKLIGADEKSIPGSITDLIEVEVVEIEISSDFFN